MPKPVVIYGNGSVAETIHYFLTHDSERDVAAFTVDREYLAKDNFLGLSLVPFDELLASYPPSEFDMFIGVGHIHVNRVRASKYHETKAMGYRLISIVNSKAITWPDLNMGDNCKIGAGARISPFVRLGNNVNIGGGSSVGHHTIVNDHSSLAPSVTIAGNVVVEPFCLIGANATIRDRITLAKGSVIGAGAVILEDTVENGVYLGSPAEKLPITSDRLQLS